MEKQVMALNQVQLIGNLGADPEIRFTQAGKKVANFSLATNVSWRDKQSGEKREHTEWHRIVVFNEGLADVIERYVRKGSKLFIQGALRTRKWQGQDGKDNWTTEVVLQGFNSRLDMLDKIESDRQPEPPAYGSAGAPDLDDEIPF